jgi:Kef-type K+ transport system membrane component KefB
METNPVIQLFLALGIIILAARIAGSIARQLGQPRVLGELIIGVILGPTLLDILHLPALGDGHLQETIKELAELGVLLLMFNIGLEVHLDELLKVGRVAALAGFAGAVVPVVLTYPLARWFGFSWEQALFAGVVLAATSVSISAQVLLELGVLQTKEGNALLATALIDDVLAILLVSLTIAITGPEGNAEPGQLGIIVARMAVYIGVAFALAWFGLPRLMNWISAHPRLSQSFGIPAFALVFALLFGWSAEALGGVAAITGAFIAGVGISRINERARDQVEEAVNNIAYAFLVPIFFVDVGLETDLRGFPLSALPLAGLLLVAAVLSKVVGCGLGALLGGFNRQEALRVGVCMISRGEVGLIIASLGLASGVLNNSDALYPSLFLVILLTTVLTPPFVRQVFQSSDQRPARGQGR